MATTRTTRKTATKPAPEPAVANDDNPILGMFRSTLKSVEGATVGLGSASVSLLSGVGLPDGVASTIKSGTTQMAQGVTGSLDGIATGSFKVAGKGFSLVSGGLGAFKL
jgi:hypothetical protein